MMTRRIVVSACALSLAVPVAAGASSANAPPETYGSTSTTYPELVKAKGPYGTTLATSPKLVKAKGPFGTTPATYPKLLKAKGPFGTTPATYPKLVAAKGPFGATVATSAPHSTGAGTHLADASGGDANSWRTAAVSEAALLAALALGSGLILLARRGPPRLGT
jgi:hypothetical protein